MEKELKVKIIINGEVREYTLEDAKKVLFEKGLKDAKEDTFTPKEEIFTPPKPIDKDDAFARFVAWKHGYLSGYYVGKGIDPRPSSKKEIPQ